MLGAPRASAKQAHMAVPPPDTHHGHHHRHHHKRRSRKSKNNQSTSVQFPDPESSSEPSWVTSENVNIESLLPSHTIHVKRSESSDDLSQNVNSAPKQEIAHTIPECSTPDKVCDVSPLENLLAVAELELKQHMQSGKWESELQEQSECIKETNKSVNPSIEEIDELIKTKAHEMQIGITDEDNKSPECSYNDDDDVSMNDILSRLEQSLQSPQGFGSDNTFDDEISEQDTKSDKMFTNLDENNKSLCDEYVNDTQILKNFEVKVKEELEENETLNYSITNHCTQAETIIDGQVNLQDLTEETESFDNHENCLLQIPILESECVENADDVSNTPDHNEELAGDFQEDITTSLNTENEYIAPSQDKDKISMSIDESVNKTCSVENINEINILNDRNHIEIEKKLYVAEEKQSETKKISIEYANKVVEAESSTLQEDKIVLPENKIEEQNLCLDLSIKKSTNLNVNAVTETTGNVLEENIEGPTDLSIRKHSSPSRLNIPSPASESSETSQSPQPSGIPAVPPSPDIVSTSTAPASKPRSAFLESLLANSINKIPFNPSTTVTKQKEPLDLGKSRKSASPTVTCSEEIIKPTLEFEPPLKKLKPNEITLKNLLDKDVDRFEQSLKKIESKESISLPETPRLISLLKASTDAQDPLVEYKQLSEEIDIPNPLMVPKEYFPYLLKHPRKAIIKILSNHANKNIPLDDILVVYKEKLLAAIETSQNNSQPSHSRSDGSKLLSKTPKTIEKNNNVNEKSASASNKKKNAESSRKTSVTSPDNKSSLANDIDAANEAVLFWSGCPNPFEAMANYSNHNEFIQALYTASTLPYLPGQLGELHPGLQMMLGNKIMPPLGFPPPPPVNVNNPFELSMWQEAMMQASMLKSKNPFENSILNQPNFRTNIDTKKAQLNQNQISKFNTKHLNNRHSKNIIHSPEAQQSFLQPSYGATALGNDSGWPNPYLGLSGFQQGSNNLSLNLPQINLFNQRNNLSPTGKQNKEAILFSQFNEQEKRLQKQMQEQQKLQQTQHHKVFRQQQQQQLLYQQQQMLRESNSHKQQLSSPLGKRQISGTPFSSSKDNLREKSMSDMHKSSGNIQGPIDLSGVQNIKTARFGGGTNNNVSNFVVTSSKSIADDVPEVGSTTGNIDEMQDAHAQLWHPLFGRNNQVSPMNQILTTLRFFATNGHQTCVGDFMGLHQSTVSRIVSKVAYAIAGLRPLYIRMPNNNEILHTQGEFYRKFRFPRVIGCIDGTHIKIQSPGDRGYAVRPFLLTPLLNTVTRGEQLYNEAHIRTRNSVERLFGVWKRRFPVLAYGFRCNIQIILISIVATAVLHNIATDAGEDFPPPPNEIDNNMLDYLIDQGNVPDIVQNVPAVAGGYNHRQQLIDNFFANL